MKILMMTNTYTPHVGGVARSVASFAEQFRRTGHETLVVAPEFAGADAQEPGVFRVPALERFDGSDFSAPLPAADLLHAAVESFGPQLVHSHHPFLLGDTALRIAASRGVPLVFTHHTLYERYIHNVPGDPEVLRRLVVELTVGYCNLCDAVIAPSGSVGRLLAERGVTASTRVIPTGVDVRRFARGDRRAGRNHASLPADVPVVGHVGRLSPEKNLEFLARSIAAFLQREQSAWCVVAGDGPAKPAIARAFEQAGVAARCRLLGILSGGELADLFAALDAFAFASTTETQGMVIAEAMAAGTPVVALDGPGVRDVVRDGVNGRLLPHEDEAGFAAALAWVTGLRAAERASLREGALATARELSLERAARAVLALYAELIDARSRAPRADDDAWSRWLARVRGEWNIVRNLLLAVARAVSEPDSLDRGTGGSERRGAE